MSQNKFPSNFIWGVATSAYQIEGAWNEEGRAPSIWDTFSHTPGKCFNNETGDVACDHYHRYLEDIDHMKKLGIKSYRFSFSWSRILPKGQGRVNDKGLDFYKRLVDGLLDADIMPNATLYHWDLPQALQDRGGWANREIMDWFGDYASLLFRKFGAVIPFWSTLNEPIANYVGYGLGLFAPGIKDEKQGKAAMHHALLAHGAGVRAFRAEKMGDSKIGVVVDIWKRHPRRDCPEDHAMALDGDENSFRFFLDPIFTGRYSPYILSQMEKAGTTPDIRPDDLLLISQPIDFYGLNVYNRIVVGEKTEPSLETSKDNFKGGNFMENGVEFYPEAAYDAITLLRKDYNLKIPIYVTENGTYSYNDMPVDGKVHDIERIRYYEGFLESILRAINEGADVRGYYLWSLLDNYEWTAATSRRFGLLHVDFSSGRRLWKDSAYWYQKVIADNGF